MLGLIHCLVCIYFPLLIRLVVWCLRILQSCCFCHLLVLCLLWCYELYRLVWLFVCLCYLLCIAWSCLIAQDRYLMGHCILRLGCILQGRSYSLGSLLRPVTSQVYLPGCRLCSMIAYHLLPVDCWMLR